MTRTENAPEALAAQQNNRGTAGWRSFFVTISGYAAYTDDRSVMCNVLPWESDRFGVDQFGTWPACRQHMSVRPAAVAAGARIDRGRRVFVSMLITGEVEA